MLKKYAVLSGIFLFASASLATAGSLDSTTGAKITITADATKAPREFVFQPSPQVTIDGDTSATAFVIAAVHGNVVGKKGGSAYAMTSETSGLYVAPVDTLTAIPGMSIPTGTTTFESMLSTAGYKLDGVAGTTTGSGD